ncbi:MAG: type I glyceraldehyde-3-phosphate dehydrogenase [Desulfurivibrionaceae bacterium]
MKLGINGLGRIGKLSLWHHVARKYFSEIIVNTGREVGQSLEDIASVIEKDSTYGKLGNYLYGYKGGRMVENLDESSGSMTVDGLPVKILREARNPKDIKWQENGVKLVLETTGVFNDPTADSEIKGGALRGHLNAGAEKAILSAPFKIKEKGSSMPDDAVTTVMGINEEDYIPTQHHLVSAASCTTTCLAFMIKPLLDQIGVENFLSASMVTVHAATGSQKVIDAVPKRGATDLRKNRSILNNIILTTTGAAKALRLVIPEMKNVGFMAESVRIPTSTGSLIILVLDLHDDTDDPIRRDRINEIYRNFDEHSPYLEYTDKQNVSSDIIGTPSAATVIEGSETHTRTASISLNLNKIQKCAPTGEDQILEVPVTQAVIYGWYDNELGSYTNMLGDRTVSIAEQMI